jgi:hypothetical protein
VLLPPIQNAVHASRIVVLVNIAASRTLCRSIRWGGR